ncbi:hypothetical protein SERLA73DRAFT_105440 [Serpula lacrymans var. lacrymans S7.3]|uniref:Uncharacterized protein n=2 Tax=Serpula lacrymans var. lacrymans TaxID=341189 RepID=F8PTB5_SERL3|nr:uncharacterized protein SERLADRAFT_447741 [Serpula lacrymans var. lacrymans S7.9]EGO00945.1 hypothetical protein SERLA73DRAFT_105440 [Serpula lacrymans var. lacrymans S7.3]EGO26564.1 hypothetical protein SERLADRAFT_447741 [Serpula lacrymans var. lacrymans S7.9]
MGVHGLTTFLRENKRVLAKTIVLSANPLDVIPIVVDAWSFIYELYDQSRLPWVYGGEYDAFTQFVVRIVQAWIAVGMKLYFVFDGAAPQLKIPTLVSRLNQSNIQHSLLFFRTSSASRSTPRFLHEVRIIPPLVYQACLHALQEIAGATFKLEIHFADNEGDPYAVELAGRLGGYVVGNDSDFVILNTDQYRGYIPLEEMVWIASVLEKPLPDEQDGGFQPVRKTKTRNKVTSEQKASRGLIPPDNTSDVTLSFSVYSPSALASHLNIPVTLLPLLGSLVGNDFSNQSSTQRNVQSLFFERHLTLSQRITRVATTLNSILSASSQKRAKAKHQVGSVMDLIDRTVNSLMIRSPFSVGSVEADAVVDRVVNATLQYAIDKYDGDGRGPESLWATDICALHEQDTCPLPSLFSRSLLLRSLQISEQSRDMVTPTEQIRAMYVQAYRSGKFQPKIMDILSTGTYWPRIFLENPDIENVGRSISRSIRQWMYAILEDGCGLPDASEDVQNEVNASEGPDDEDSDQDELIDVAEEHSDDDLLAPLRGELEKLRGSEDDELTKSIHPQSISPRSCSRPPPRLKRVLEYTRRGTRVASEEVRVPDIRELLSAPSLDVLGLENWAPVQYKPLSDRMVVFLHALHSNMTSVMILPPEQLLAALTLRWVLFTVQSRALRNGASKEREKERWTRHEAQAFLLSFVPSASRTLSTTSVNDENILLMNRSIQLTAQALTALEAIHQLSQVLLLSDRVPCTVHKFSGQNFHSLLNRPGTLGTGIVPDGLWMACVEGLEDAFAEERRKKTKTKKGNTGREQVDSLGGPQQRAVKYKLPGVGMYGLLGSVDT